MLFNLRQRPEKIESEGTEPSGLLGTAQKGFGEAGVFLKRLCS
jgi:hypothetical protein